MEVIYSGTLPALTVQTFLYSHPSIYRAFQGKATMHGIWGDPVNRGKRVILLRPPKSQIFRPPPSPYPGVSEFSKPPPSSGGPDFQQLLRVQIQ